MCQWEKVELEVDFVSSIQTTNFNSADQNECGMEIPLQQSRPRVMRTRRIKAEKDRSVGVCDNPISNACNINVGLMIVSYN